MSFLTSHAQITQQALVGLLWASPVPQGVGVWGFVKDKPWALKVYASGVGLFVAVLVAAFLGNAYIW